MVPPTELCYYILTDKERVCGFIHRLLISSARNAIAEVMTQLSFLVVNDFPSFLMTLADLFVRVSPDVRDWFVTSETYKSRY